MFVLEEIVLLKVLPPPGPHGITPPPSRRRDRFPRPNAADRPWQEMKPTDAAFRQMRYLANPRKRLKNQAQRVRDTSRATVARSANEKPTASFMRNYEWPYQWGIVII